MFGQQKTDADVPQSKRGGGGRGGTLPTPVTITVNDKSEYSSGGGGGGGGSHSHGRSGEQQHRQASFVFGRVEQSFDASSARGGGDDDGAFRCPRDLSGSHLESDGGLGGSSMSSSGCNQDSNAVSFEPPSSRTSRAFFGKDGGVGSPLGSPSGDGQRRATRKKASVNFLVSFDDFANDDDDDSDRGREGGPAVAAAPREPASPGRRVRGNLFSDKASEPDGHRNTSARAAESCSSSSSLLHKHNSGSAGPLGSPLRANRGSTSHGYNSAHTAPFQSLPTVTMDISKSVRARRSVVQHHPQYQQHDPPPTAAATGLKAAGGQSGGFCGDDDGPMTPPGALGTGMMPHEGGNHPAAQLHNRFHSPTPPSRAMGAQGGRPTPHGGGGDRGGGGSSPLSPNAASAIETIASATTSPLLPTEPKQAQHATVRERAILARIADRDRKEMDLMRSNERQALAEENKLFHREHKYLQREASWMTYLVHAAAVAALHSVVVSGRSTRKSGPPKHFFPIIALRLRQALRRARTNILGRGVVRPSVAVLRSDKMMNLFPDTQLQHAIDHMTLKYYFSKETVIMMGSEDDEAYILESGSADVVMGTTKVFTLRAKMSFGSVGMISGEPRTASIIACEPCLVWVIKRDVFNAGGGTGSTDDQEKLAAAHAAINELRQQNMLNVYKKQLDPSTLGYFPLFNGVAHETLVSITTNGTRPRVARGGTALIASNQPLQHVAPFILLRGSVTVQLPKAAWLGRNAHNQAPLHELLRQLFDVPYRRRGGGSSGAHPAFRYCEMDVETLFAEAAAVLAQQRDESEMSCAMNPSVMVRRGTATTAAQAEDSSAGNNTDTGGGVCVDLCVVEAPALFQLAPMFAIGGTLSLPFAVVARKDCDIMGIGRSALRSQDVLELAVVRQNALNLHCEFMKPPPQTELCKLWFRDVAAASPSVAASLLNVTNKCVKALSGGALGGASSPPPPAAASSVGGDHHPHHHHHHSSLSYEKWVVAPQDHLMFDPQNNFMIYVVLRGELETHGSLGTAGLRPPFVWPPMAFGWFGTRNLTARAKTHVDVLRIRRSELISFVCREVLSDFLNSAAATTTTTQHFARTSASHELLHGLIKILAADYFRQTQAIPSLSIFGLDEEFDGDLHTQSSNVASQRSAGGSTTTRRPTLIGWGKQRKKSVVANSGSFARKRSIVHSYGGGSANRHGSVIMGGLGGCVDIEPLWLTILQALTGSVTASLRKANNASATMPLVSKHAPPTAQSHSVKHDSKRRGERGSGGVSNQRAHHRDKGIDDDDDDDDYDDDEGDGTGSSEGPYRRTSSSTAPHSDASKSVGSLARKSSSGWIRPTSSSPHGRPLFQSSSSSTAATKRTSWKQPPATHNAATTQCRPSTATPLSASQTNSNRNTARSHHHHRVTTEDAMEGGGRFLVSVPSNHQLLAMGGGRMDSPPMATTHHYHASVSVPALSTTQKNSSMHANVVPHQPSSSRSSSSSSFRHHRTGATVSQGCSPVQPSTGRAYDFLLEAMRSTTDNGAANSGNNGSSHQPSYGEGPLRNQTTATSVAVQYLPVRHKVPRGALGHRTRTPTARKQ